MTQYSNTKYVPTVAEDGSVFINGKKIEGVTSKTSLLRILCIPTSEMKNEVFKSTSSPAEYKKTMNKRIGDELGMTPSTLFNWYKKLWYKHNVAPVKDYGFLFIRKHIVLKDLWLVKKHKHILDQAMKDNQKHLLPILMKTGKTPQELKEIVGKGCWKKLCANTFGRNREIAKGVLALGNSNIKTYFAWASSTPTTLLSTSNIYSPATPFLVNQCRGIWGNKKAVRDMGRLFTDTLYQATQLGQHFNENWSVRRMKEEHDRMSKEILARKYTKEGFEWMGDKQLPDEVVVDGLKAILLRSPFAMQEEGTTQRHCVAGYTQYVADGEYIVYSIRKEDGSKESTAGFVKEHGKFVLQQHYGFANSTPSTEAKTVVAKLCEMLDKTNLSY